MHLNCATGFSDPLKNPWDYQIPEK